MKKIILSLGTFLLPVLALAQTPDESQVLGILAIVKKIVNAIIPIVISLAVIYFIWGVVQYVTAGDEEKRKTGRDHMIYGVIGLFVIVSIWGLVGLLGTATGVGQGGTVPLPTIGL